MADQTAAGDYEALRAGIDGAVPFNSHLGLEFVALGDGEATVVLPDDDHLRNHVGSQHAGAIFSAGEAASGGAFVGAFAELLGELTPLARGASIDYLRIARGPITANARLGRDKAEILAAYEAEGRTDFPVAVELLDGAGERVAEMTVEWHIRRNA